MVARFAVSDYLAGEIVHTTAPMDGHLLYSYGMPLRESAQTIQQFDREKEIIGKLERAGNDLEKAITKIEYHG